MVAFPATILPEMLIDDNRRRWHQSAIIAAKEAQDIYKVPSREFKKAAITSLIKKHFFEELPKIFDKMAIQFHKEIQEQKALDAESYQEARILYDISKPFFDKVKNKDIKTHSTASDEKENRLQESLVKFLNTLKEYITYLEEKFAEFDKPKYKTTHFTHVPESELWAMRNKNRSYLI